MTNPENSKQSSLAEEHIIMLSESLRNPPDGQTIEERQKLMKQLLGWKIAARAESGEIIGLGSGSTSQAAIEALRMRVRQEGLAVSAVATSVKLSNLAQSDGLIPVLVSPQELLSGVEIPILDWGFDGADEIETDTGRLIKGGGAAHRIERLVADATPHWIVIADQSKLVPALGKFPVPVEVEIGAEKELIERFMREYKANSARLRTDPAGTTIRTDSGNYIIDVGMGQGNIPMGIEEQWLSLPGVVSDGVGIFTGYGQEIWIAQDDGEIKMYPGAGAKGE